MILTPDVCKSWRGCIIRHSLPLPLFKAAELNLCPSPFPFVRIKIHLIVTLVGSTSRRLTFYVLFSDFPPIPPVLCYAGFRAGNYGFGCWQEEGEFQEHLVIPPKASSPTRRMIYVYMESRRPHCEKEIGPMPSSNSRAKSLLGL